MLRRNSFAIRTAQLYRELLDRIRSKSTFSSFKCALKHFDLSLTFDFVAKTDKNDF